jgi:hypothetical protein
LTQQLAEPTAHQSRQYRPARAPCRLVPDEAPLFAKGRRAVIKMDAAEGQLCFVDETSIIIVKLNFIIMFLKLVDHFS